MRRSFLTVIPCALLAFACSKGDDADDGGSGSAEGDAGEADATASAGSADGPIKLDVEGDDMSNPCAEGEGGSECPCEPSEHDPCDDGTADVLMAIGLNCPDGPEGSGGANGSPDAIGILNSFGNTDAFDPTEGVAMVALGTGLVAELSMETPMGDSNVTPMFCNDDLDAGLAMPMYDQGMTLPAPLIPVDVPGDCVDDPDLLGTGDCSSTMQGQFDQGRNANDYTEMRLALTVPELNDSFSYDFAFLSTEYPQFYGSEFNDMYVGWLESERWTGNISFDNMGNPISLNAGFLNYKDDAHDTPELAGTCMRQHGATKWLTTTSPAKPGESFELVFAIFDLSDSRLDSYVLIDNFAWGCDGTDRPETVPQG